MTNDAEYAAWERGNLRGLNRGRYLGTEKDEEGRDVRVYQADDSEWGNTLPVFVDSFYSMVKQPDPYNFQNQHDIHLTQHRGAYDPACRYCQQYLETRVDFFGR